ncbi:MAG: TonB-dependent receptor [Lunatimonas sp.]|uniref:SusC/RagA family TonB-linked outer membrane protein n=1 Tax=Lunatimonas sp. TaxID=2060141 RepID=UPI00263B2B9C|nr:TonB-dependent receptor [Lunatimonas sp.]MCC5937101.1 TonB-dependent receptor [Lunatimonas sp.]
MRKFMLPNLPFGKIGVIGRRICLLFVIFLYYDIAMAQVSVSGTIRDDSGETLPGVNVQLKGTSSGTISNIDGSYSITVPNEQAVLVFSFIGLTTQEVTVGNRTVIDITMDSSLEALSEVVVVGYGVQRKSDITGAMSSIGDRDLRDVPVANITQALQGRAAGVEINSTSSRPGAGGQIRIRGSRSFTGSNDPLIVVDGIPFTGTINDINPDDITSLDILKDASATAIYGSRGSNGVILITTRRGTSGKTEFYYNGYTGINGAIGQYRVMNGQEFSRFRDEAVAAGAAYAATDDEAANLAAGRDVNWQDEMYQGGYITNHLVGALGGTETTQFNLSAGYFKETTVIPGQDFQRYSLQGVIDQKIGSRVKIGMSTKNSFNINNGEGVSNMFSLLTLSPLFNAYEPDGSINVFPGIGSPNPETINPLLVRNQDNWAQQRRRLRTFNSLYGEVKLAEGLTYRLNVGVDLSQDNYGFFAGSNTPFRNGSVNQAEVQNTNSWSYTLEHLINYDKTFGEDHKFSFTGLFSAQEAEDFGSAALATGLPADYMLYYNLGLGTSSVPLNNNFYARWGLLSYMGRVNYAFQDRFLVTLTARADGSSRLAAGNKWFYYPAAAFAWNMHNESFLQGSEVLSNLKLRFGIGTTSNQAVNPYASLGGLGGFDGRTAEPYNFGSTGAFGYLVTASPNNNLTWEFTTTTNLGLDFGLFNNRIMGTLEVYQQDTKDILQFVTLPPTSGVGGVTRNVGESRNRGIELTLNTLNVERPSGFTWTTDINLYLNRSEIRFLAGGVDADIARGWHVGHPIDVIYDFEKIGIVQEGETYLPGFFPGMIKIKDQPTIDTTGDGIPDTPDGVINADDRVILGTPQADWAGGLTSRMSYKGFDFNVVAFGRVGGMLVSNFYQANIGNPINSMEGRRNGPLVDYWTPDNPTNAFPRPGMGQVPEFGSTLGYFDATFMKIRSMQLGYSFSNNFLERNKLSSLYIYLQAQNPFQAFFSEYVRAGGLDPETNGFGGSVTPGFGPNGTNRLTVNPNTPPTRAFILGINFRY